MKPKIALIVDVYDWAFYNRSVILKEKLKEYYDIDIIPADTALENNMLQLILLVQDYDLVHFFWRRILFNLSDDNYYFIRNELSVQRLLKEKFSHVATTSCVPDHMLLDDENKEQNLKALNWVDNYYVLSQKLWNIYAGLNCQKPYGVIAGGVDLDKFKPQNLERLKTIPNRNLIIGWSGNSKWGGKDNKEDVKGVQTILIPAVEELQKEGYPVELKLADKSKGMTAIDKMPDYYNTLDLYVCTSKTEGGPYPILEAMACGLPIISTDVGFVPEVLGEKEKEYILKERTIEALKEKIKSLLQNPERLLELSNENLNSIKNFGYEEIIPKFKAFFDDTLKKKEAKNE